MHVFSVDFIAPLFHNLFPDRSFDVKRMTVPSATAILSYIRLSYPNVRADLDSAIKMGNRILPSQMILLKNMRDMFEYFIPTVSLVVQLFIMFFCFITLHNFCWFLKCLFMSS